MWFLCQGEIIENIVYDHKKEKYLAILTLLESVSLEIHSSEENPVVLGSLHVYGSRTLIVTWLGAPWAMYSNTSLLFEFNESKKKMN